jgi:hypothetical protein
MSLKINAEHLGESQSLVLESDGLNFIESAENGCKRHFRFNEIECLLLSDDHVLSFQAGGRAYAIQTKPDDAKHQAVIATLVDALKIAEGGWGVGGQ